MLNWSVSKTIDFYKHYSQKYDNEITPNSYPAPSLLASWVNNYLSFSPAFILDVGCGTGQSSKLFLNDNLKYSVTGIDASPDMLKIAQKYPFKKLLCQNITDPLQTDGILYNAILCVGVLDFIDDKLSILTSFHNHLDASKPHCVAITLPEDEQAHFMIDEMLALCKRAKYDIIKFERILGYKDSETDAVTYYYAFLLKIDLPFQQNHPC